MFIALRFALTAVLFNLLGGCTTPPVSDFKAKPEEKFIKSLRKLTFAGVALSPRWSNDNQWLTFQHSGPGLLNEAPLCDQIYRIRSDGTELKRLTYVLGRVASPSFFPSSHRILLGSTVLEGRQCPLPLLSQKPPFIPVHFSSQLLSIELDAKDPLFLEPGAPSGFNGEAQVCRDGSVIFTSSREGNLNLYTGKLDELGVLTRVKQITKTMGYDGQAKFSPDCRKIVWRSYRPQGKLLKQFAKDVANRRFFPKAPMELWIANADGTNVHPLTRFRAMSSAPTFTPDGQSIVFSSNLHRPQGQDFNLYKLSILGTSLERITWSQGIDTDPEFSPDGRFLAFSSQKDVRDPNEILLYIAEWTEERKQAP